MTEEKTSTLSDWKLARSLVEPLYKDQKLNSGESRLAHSDGIVEILQGLRNDSDLFTAAYLFSVDDYIDNADEWIEKKFGSPVKQLVEDMHHLMRVSERARGEDKEAQAVYQPEALRRMVLAMCHDLRVVILRLASRVQTLRYFAANPSSAATRYGEETLEIYAPLANRLGVSQIKVELENLSLLFTKPDKYNEIQASLAKSQEERVEFVNDVKARLKAILASRGVVPLDIGGRPKHIYSIYKKMERKHLKINQLYDIYALRVIVDSVEKCYEVLSAVQENFSVISKEFDDYIANPKPNGYQSLHTVIVDNDQHPVEIQIRTKQMHEFAELGVAAHWRYKERGNSEKSVDDEEQKVAWLRQILAWRNDVNLPETPGFDETHIYALTPQGRVVELQAGSTPIDFAYMIHTQLGHRCRGARVNGVMVPLNTKLATGQTVEIVTVKEGGPSRDWLNPELGFAASPRTRTKVRQWFNAQTLAEQISAGRERLDKELARLGKTAVKLDDLAKRLGFESVDDLYVSFAKEELSTRAIEQALTPRESEPEKQQTDVVLKATKRGNQNNILVVGMDSLMTQLARCCHPAPPDEIVGFVTRGKGVTIHRIDCPNVKNLTNVDSDRMIDVSWGNSEDVIYPVDIIVVAKEMGTLLKDVSEVFTRESQRIIGMTTMSVKGDVHMRISIEIRSSEELSRSLVALRDLNGVLSARRA